MQPVIWRPEGNAGEGDFQQPGFLAWAGAEVAPDKAQAVLGSSVVTTAAWALLLSLHLPKSLHLEAAVQDHPGHALCADNTGEQRRWSSVPGQNDEVWGNGSFLAVSGAFKAP